MRAAAVIDSRMRPANIAFLVLAVALAIVCVRLGFWQLNRREIRRASNAMIEARTLSPPLPVGQLEGDTTGTRFRRVIVSGRPDFEHETMLTHRGNNGAPGLDIITPVRIAGTDTAVLVNRGWIYSPDGMTADLARWREADTTFSGYVDSFETSESKDSVRRGGIRRMDFAAISRTIPYPIRPFYVVALGEPVAALNAPSSAPRIVRLRPPKLGAGNHLSYAFQWFGFAMIAVVGASIVTARSMRSKDRNRGHQNGPTQARL